MSKYFRPFSHFNIGKKQEFRDRVWFTEDLACPCKKEEAA